MSHRNHRNPVTNERGSTNALEFTPEQKEIFAYLTAPRAHRRTLAALMLLNATTLEEQADILQGIRLGGGK